jgi:hypothetical protein
LYEGDPMRAYLAALLLILGASGAQAQLGVPFGAYEPTPAFLVPGNNLNNCRAAPATDPYNRDVRRGGQPSDEKVARDPNCPPP